jgi:hypothetical protein
MLKDIASLRVEFEAVPEDERGLTVKLLKRGVVPRRHARLECRQIHGLGDDAGVVWINVWGERGKIG